MPNLTRRRARLDVLAAVAAGGAVGGLARLLLNTALPAAEGSFPWSTLLENVSGCLLIGVLMVFLLEVWAPGRYVRPFLGVGVLGGFTTFSAYTADARALLLAGAVPAALLYLVGTVLGGLAATWLGLTAARTVVGAGRPRRVRRPR